MSKASGKASKRWDELQDEDIDLSDIPQLGDEFFLNAKARGPLIQKGTVLVDPQVYDWFRHNVPDYERAINQLLAAYMNERTAK